MLLNSSEPPAGSPSPSGLLPERDLCPARVQFKASYSLAVSSKPDPPHPGQRVLIVVDLSSGPAGFQTCWQGWKSKLKSNVIVRYGFLRYSLCISIRDRTEPPGKRKNKHKKIWLINFKQTRRGGEGDRCTRRVAGEKPSPLTKLSHPPSKKKKHGFVVQDLVLPCDFWLSSACVCMTVTRMREPSPRDSCPFSHPTSCCQGRSERTGTARRGWQRTSARPSPGWQAPRGASKPTSSCAHLPSSFQLAAPAVKPPSSHREQARERLMGAS